MFLASCSITETREDIYKHRLTRHNWVVNTYVDNSINQVLDMPIVIYHFSEDGTLTKSYSNGETYTAEWAFCDKLNYLLMGNNTFRINSLTSKVLSVSYGDIDIFFVPAE